MGNATSKGIAFLTLNGSHSQRIGSHSSRSIKQSHWNGTNSFKELIEGRSFSEREKRLQCQIDEFVRACTRYKWAKLKRVSLA